MYANHGGRAQPGRWFGGVLALAILGSAGCGDDGHGLGNQNDGGTQDASVIDVDQDQDGFPASQDCDDADPAVRPGVAQPCNSDCDDGYRICLATAAWSECTAITECECTSAGAQRVIDCGRCGSTAVTCGLDLRWEYPSECSGEGACLPGELEIAPCEYCGTRTRFCTESCGWQSWDESGCSGECEAGTQEVADDWCAIWEIGGERTCSPTCAWEVDVPCDAGCTVTPRTDTDDFSDEVCVPGGEFIMGRDGSMNDDYSPPHVVALSPYLIDVYEVSVARFRGCVDAGACDLPGEGSTYFQADSDALPINMVDWRAAVDFCTWDGRRLPTEAEWEKAARGPSPSETAMPWGDTPPNCMVVPASDCEGITGPVSVDSYAMGASPYGVMNLCGNVSEWVKDVFAIDYYESSPYLDPQGPPPDVTANHTKRGQSYWVSTASHEICNYWRDGDSIGRTTRGLRCARNGR